MRQVFLDTETTGLSPDNGDRLVELGCVEMVNRRLTGRNLHFYLNPQRPNSEEAVRVHGLTDEFLADKPLFATVAEEFIEYLRGAEVIIHNAAFDVGFLDAEFRRVHRPGVATLACGIVDTLAMAREACSVSRRCRMASPASGSMLKVTMRRPAVNTTTIQTAASTRGDGSPWNNRSNTPRRRSQLITSMSPKPARICARNSVG